VIRNKKEITVKIIIDELPTEVTQAKVQDEPMSSKVTEILGMEFKNLDSKTKKKLNINKGVVVSNVSGDAATEAGIRVGDVITMLDNRSIASISDIKSVAAQLSKGKSVAMLVQRTTGPVFLAIRP